MTLDLSAYKPVVSTVTDATSITAAFTAIEAAVNALPTSTVPAGVVAPFGGAAAPTGWLVCDGSAVSRTTYASLFTAIGTTYGAGNGTTTFNLPDLRGRMVAGYSAAGHADVATLGNTDGTALAARRPKHKQTVVQPTISTPTISVSADSDAGNGGAFSALLQALTGASRLKTTTTNTPITATASTPVASGGTVGPQTGAEPTDAPAYIVLTWVVKT